MWYSSGTVSATNNSNVITGTGTAFLANVRIGDGITIQGSQSLHEVIGIASNTQLTIRPAFTGTSGSGKQFACAPILGYDKDLSDAFNQLRLQFGDKLSALQPWAYAATANAALDALGFSSVGKTVATGNAAQGRAGLALGTAATRDAFGATGALLSQAPSSPTGLNPGLYLGSSGQVDVATWDRVDNPWNDVRNLSLRLSANNNALAFGLSSAQNSRLAAIQVGHGAPSFATAVGVLDLNPVGGEVRINRFSVRTSGNTTVDANGFIKNASPILKLHADRIESNSDDTPAFQRLDTGHYQITGCNGLRLDDGWYIETPHDKNGNKYFNVEWEQDQEPETDAGVLDEPAGVTLTVRCFERVWNPATGQFDNGDPVDIPAGRWIDLRLNEVRQPEPEVEEAVPADPQQPKEPVEPTIPSVVSMAQAKLALLYADLYEAAEQFINDLPEPHKTAALIEWNHRPTLEREHPLVGQVAAGLGLTEQQVDELFLDASLR